MSRYARPLRLIHWIAALIVGAVLMGGLLIGFLGFKGVTDLLGGPGRDFLYQYHKTGGLIILLVMLFRIHLRRRHGKPDYNPPIEAWEKKISGIVQYALYGALIAMPLLGWFATDALDYPVEFFAWDLPQIIPKNESVGGFLFGAHEWLGWGIVVLLGLHIGGALKHAVIAKDQVLNRIWPI